MTIDSDLDTGDEIYQDEEEDDDEELYRLDDLSLDGMLLEYFTKDYNVEDYWAVALFSLFQQQVLFIQMTFPSFHMTNLANFPSSRVNLFNETVRLSFVTFPFRTKSTCATF